MTRAFIPNPDFQREAESAFGDGARDIAEDVATEAEQMARSVGAPWMPRPGHDLIEVEETEDGVYVVNTDYGAHLQEYGSINNPAHAPLRRAAMAQGLEVEEE